MIEKLGGTLKKAIVTYLRVLPYHSCGSIKEATRTLNECIQHPDQYFKCVSYIN
jgi:hypothetical protein